MSPHFFLLGVAFLLLETRSLVTFSLLFGTTWIVNALAFFALLIEPAALRYAVGAAVAFAPIFLANLVFAHAFRDSEEADLAFASNLLGAMVGGALEWLALLMGYQALLLLVAVTYVAAYQLRTRRRILGDRVRLTPAAT